MVNGFEPNYKNSFRPGGAKLAGRERKGHGGRILTTMRQRKRSLNFSNSEVSG
jgi:hypothetical protein